MSEKTLRCDAPETPAAIWDAITQTTSAIIDELTAQFPELGILEEDLIFTDDEILTVEQFVQNPGRPLSNFSLLQRTVTATVDEVQGILIVCTWESRNKSRIRITFEPNILRERAISAKFAAIEIVAIVACVWAYGYYKAGPRGRTPYFGIIPNVGLIFLGLWGVIPGAILGWLIWLAFSAIHRRRIPYALSEKMVEDSRQVLLERLREKGWADPPAKTAKQPAKEKSPAA